MVVLVANSTYVSEELKLFLPGLVSVKESKLENIFVNLSGVRLGLNLFSELCLIYILWQLSTKEPPGETPQQDPEDNPMSHSLQMYY